jgi:hypothetical protein
MSKAPPRRSRDFFAGIPHIYSASSGAGRQQSTYCDIRLLCAVGRRRFSHSGYRWGSTAGGGCPTCSVRVLGVPRPDQVGRWLCARARFRGAESLDGRMVIRPYGPPSPAPAGLGGSAGEYFCRNVAFLCNIQASRSVYIQKRGCRRQCALGPAKPQDPVS